VTEPLGNRGLSSFLERNLRNSDQVSYNKGMDTNQQDPNASSDDERSRKFLRTLAKDPFLAVLVDDQGEVTIYSKGLEPEHLDRIKQVLSEELKG
jgi:hypothetical protein